LGYRDFKILKLPVYNVVVYLFGAYPRVIFSDGKKICNQIISGNTFLKEICCELIFTSNGPSYCYVVEFEYNKSRFHKSEVVYDLLDIYFNPLSEW